MANVFTLKFEGGAELAKALNDLPAALSRKVLREALKEAGEPIRAIAESRAPRSAQKRPGAEPEGHLQDNIVISAGRAAFNTDTSYTVAVGPRADYFYGRFQEFGTVYHRAQPFLRPGFDGGSKDALEILADELWWALRKSLPRVSVSAGAAP